MNDLTVHFEGDWRTEEEGGVRRKVARRGQKSNPLSRKCVEHATLKAEISEASGARRGCASLTLARNTEVA